MKPAVCWKHGEFRVERADSGYRCRSCAAEYTREYKKRKPETYAERRRFRLSKYGLTPEQFNALWETQNNRCAVCLTDKFTKIPHVDHCHETGRVRGLLCQNCNTRLIGVLEKAKRQNNLRRAFAYLGWLN